MRHKNKKEKEGEKIKYKKQKHKKRRWDAIVVGIGMTTAFVIVLMKLTGYWPCEILSLHIEEISCDKSIQDNVMSMANWLQNDLFDHF
jgi:nicotinamide riboside transporter PnuC